MKRLTAAVWRIRTSTRAAGSEGALSLAPGAQRGKVGIVPGDGSGRLPVFTGYCGEARLAPAQSALYSPGRPSPFAWTPSNRLTATPWFCASMATMAVTG